MKYYYSPSLGGFFRDDIHGPLTVEIPDPNFDHPMVRVPDPKWRRPVIKIPDPKWQPPTARLLDPETQVVVAEIADPTAKAPLIEILDPEATPDTVETPDPAVVHPTVVVKNPRTGIPEDAIELSTAAYEGLIAGQAAGREIVMGASGTPTTRPRVATPDQVRATRNNLLKDSDWVGLRAQELGEPVPTPWREYRQALRDVPLQRGFPTNVKWPLAPG